MYTVKRDKIIKVFIAWISLKTNLTISYCRKGKYSEHIEDNVVCRIYVY